MPAFPAPKAEISRLWDQGKGLQRECRHGPRFCETCEIVIAQPTRGISLPAPAAHRPSMPVEVREVAFSRLLPSCQYHTDGRDAELGLPSITSYPISLFVDLSGLKCNFFCIFRFEDDHQRAAERREAARRSHDAYDILPYGFRPLRTAGT